MSRVKRGLARHKRHKKLLAAAKGYSGRRSKTYKTAKEAVLHAGAYAFHGRKLKKRDARGQWIVRISAASREAGIPYNKLISSLRKDNIKLDRKILSQIAVEDPQTFAKILENVKIST